MPKNGSMLGLALGRLLTVIQGEETRAVGSREWAATHAALERAEALYWAEKRAALDALLGGRTLREQIGSAWLARHPRALPAIQDVERHLRDFARQA
jgi:hypothetical protein